MSGRRSKAIRRLAAAQVVAECKRRGLDPSRGVFKHHARMLRRAWNRTPEPARRKVGR